MDGRQLLCKREIAIATLIFTGGLLFPAASAQGAENSCSALRAKFEICKVTPTIGDGRVDVGASGKTPGGQGSKAGGGATVANPAHAPAVVRPADSPTLVPGLPAQTPPCANAMCRDLFGIIPLAVAHGPITLTDIASFHTTAGEQQSEPAGWAIIGLETNFYLKSEIQIVDGTLLELPASVRFTPVSWQWNYGDGQSRVTNTGGNSWRALRLQEFDPTPTSHIYDRDGTFTAQATVRFHADYRFAGSDWVSIDGTVSVAANPVIIITRHASTVLVGADCHAKPHGVGC